MQDLIARGEEALLLNRQAVGIWTLDNPKKENQGMGAHRKKYSGHLIMGQCVID